jgi:ribosomal protein S18 acetylase RimI-like enzyme
VEFLKFNPKIHDSAKVAELIINSTSYHNSFGLTLKELNINISSKIVNDISLFENIYVLLQDNKYLGVIIFSYNKKSNSLITLIKLLIKLKINEFFEKLYLFFLKSDRAIGNADVYLDLIYIEPMFRNNGKGTFAINKLIQLIENGDSKQIKLHVDSNNIIARNFYEKLGFKYSINTQDISDSDIMVMEYNLN